MCCDIRKNARTRALSLVQSMQVDSESSVYSINTPENNSRAASPLNAIKSDKSSDDEDSHEEEKPIYRYVLFVIFLHRFYY